MNLLLVKISLITKNPIPPTIIKAQVTKFKRTSSLNIAKLSPPRISNPALLKDDIAWKTEIPIASSIG